MSQLPEGALEQLRRRIDSIKKQGLARQEMVLSSPASAPLLRIGGREVIDLSSNDYLGLSSHPAVVVGACEAARKWGAGARASRLVSGATALHVAFEQELATFLGYPSCLVLGSGYLANCGLLQVLAREGDLVYSDRLNHASIVDGCRLSRAQIRVFGHCDTEELASLLKEDEGQGGMRIIITETTFSMDGDEAPVAELASLAELHGAVLIADEAHSFGIKGPGGRGLAYQRGPHIIMGTLGKALGSYGAFIASQPEVREFLLASCRTLIYSTALPPPVVGAAFEALKIVAGPEGEDLRKRLRRNCALMREKIAQSGWESFETEGPLFFLKTSGSQLAIQAQQLLIERGIFVRAMRYPTVPLGQERLRLVANANLQESHIEKLGKALKEVRTLLRTCSDFCAHGVDKRPHKV